MQIKFSLFSIDRTMKFISVCLIVVTKELFNCN